MNFLWLVQKGEVTPEGRQAMEAARHAHHAAFAEAQMIASTAVMDELDVMTTALSELYGRTMRLEEGHPVPAAPSRRYTTSCRNSGAAGRTSAP
ncbi:hypothetical protein [Streptomyces sp. NBC_01443]|uniref:hypothetical protein n=1 Tax=Streptomyces sp. NBC_01443 TaxID=2903868 RepID=UPI00224CA060|nr:hypothetical protein [Streptomyces sp. NBC_01443]MCX4625575.1 hypothetical protein [Streptomyces sp. NBC_01443]